MFRILFLGILLLGSTLLKADSHSFQQKRKPFQHSRKGQFAFYWGYNREWFTKSQLHMHGPAYDFTLYDIKAKDRPQPFTIDDYFNPTKISIPQFNIRGSYHITDRWVVSAGYDHMKYVMVQDQSVIMSGVIGNDASVKYQGTYLNQSQQLKTDFLKFEHTDGLNLVTVDIEYLMPLFDIKKIRGGLSWNTGIGGFLVVPRSDVRVFEYGLNNRFHIGGYAMAAKTGPRLFFMNRFFIAAEVKAGYITLPDILVHNDAPDRADQNFGFLQAYVVGGVCFRLKPVK